MEFLRSTLNEIKWAVLIPGVLLAVVAIAIVETKAAINLASFPVLAIMIFSLPVTFILALHLPVLAALSIEILGLVLVLKVLPSATGVLVWLVASWTIGKILVVWRESWSSGEQAANNRSLIDYWRQQISSIGIFLSFGMPGLIGCLGLYQLYILFRPSN